MRRKRLKKKGNNSDGGVAAVTAMVSQMKGVFEIFTVGFFIFVMVTLTGS